MTPRTSYNPVAKFCHWTIVIIIAVQFVTSWLMPSLRHVTGPNIFINIHMSAISMFLIPIALLLFYLRFAKPVVKEIKIGEEMMYKAASVLQYALYTLLIIVPLSGWATASIHHLPVEFFGIFSLPALTISDPSFMFTLGRMHGDLSNILGILALGHIGAALYHHFVLKDNVFTRMSPIRRA